MLRRFMQQSVLWSVCAAVLLTGLPAKAAETVFNYDGFYARLKKSEQAKYASVTLAFFLQQTNSANACQASGATITTDITSEPLTIAGNGELLLPYSELLNNRKALIRIQQPDGAVPCDLNFRLRSRMPLDATVTVKQLQQLQQQLNELLRDLAGLGRYFLPEMTGVTLIFNDTASIVRADAALMQRLSCQHNQCQLVLKDWPAKQAAATDQAGATDSASVQFAAAPDHLVPLLQARSE